MSEKPLHILIISSWFPNKIHPTEGSFVYEQAKALQNRGHLVRVIKPNLSGTAKEYWTGKSYYNPGTKYYTYLDIPVWDIVQPVIIPKLGQFNYTFLFTKVFGKVSEYIRKYGKPDIIHSHAAFMGGVCAAQLSYAYKISLIHTEHTSGLIFNPSQYSSFEIKQFKNLAKQAKEFLFVSEFAKQKTQENLNVEIPQASVLFNLVDSSFFNSTLNNEGEYYVCIGNYNERKNQDFLWEAWRKFRTDNPNAKLLFIGNGFENAGWYEEAKQRNVNFLPAQDRHNILQYISKSKAVISVAKVETFGLTLAEALACGKPVIACDSGGPRDFITKETGYLVNQNDHRALLDALHSIENKNTFNPQFLREYALKHFSEESICSTLENMYNN